MPRETGDPRPRGENHADALTALGLSDERLAACCRDARRALPKTGPLARAFFRRFAEDLHAAAVGRRSQAAAWRLLRDLHAIREAEIEAEAVRRRTARRGSLAVHAAA